jgi:hypothetical protein
MGETTAGVGPGRNEGLGPLPEPDVTALCDYFDASGQRHSMAYGVDAVSAMLAAERERCAKLCEALVDPVAKYGDAEYSAGATECARRIRA